MGADKALLVVDGEAMAVRVAEALAEAGASPVRAIGGDATALAARGLAVVPDAEPGAGPLMATITALRAASTEVVLVASCDLLHPDPAAMRELVRVLDAAPGSVLAVPLTAGRLQWTHVAWRRAALGALEQAYAHGERSIHRAVADLPRTEVSHLPARALADADEPSDLSGETGDSGSLE